MLIGEVSRRSGVSTRMLRHYDALGLVTPTGRTSGGYREYTTDDIRRLFHVESLRSLGLSLHEAKRALDELDFAPAELVHDLIRHTRARIAAETELLARLERVDSAAPEAWEDVLRIVTLLHAFESESGSHRQQAVLSQHENAALPVEALAEAVLAEDDPNVAGALRWSLARAGAAGLAELAAGLDSADADVRRRAIVAVAEMHLPDATALLTKALDDSDTTVRDRAAVALGSRGAGEAVPILLEMVVEGRADVEAAEVLGILAAASVSTVDVVAAVQEVLDGTLDAPARLRVTQALAEIPGPAARDVLVALTGHHDRVIATTASVILDRRASP